MPKKRHKPEQSIGKLRDADAMLAATFVNQPDDAKLQEVGEPNLSKHDLTRADHQTRSLGDFGAHHDGLFKTAFRPVGIVPAVG